MRSGILSPQSPLNCDDWTVCARPPGTKSRCPAARRGVFRRFSEDIITELARFWTLSVSSRNSSFQFHGQSVGIQAVVDKLDVQYVVEGGVRRAGRRVRITMQFIDGGTENHVWAERYDREIDDIFSFKSQLQPARCVIARPDPMSAQFDLAICLSGSKNG